MRNNRLLSSVALFLLAGTLVAGVLFLADKDASTGEGYPQYSSLRADPLGTKVLYDSLLRIDGLAVSRNFLEKDQIRQNGSSIFFFGIPELTFILEPAGTFVEWERLAQNHRLVITLEPSSNSIDLTDQRKKSAFAKRWKVELGKAGDERSLWRRGFDRFEGWTPALSAEGKAIVIERKFGHGSVVLAADSRFIANGALANRDETKLLSQVVGPNPDILFDEAHFGMEESGSVMGLARKYHLQGLLLGLAILTALFIWKTGMPFPQAAGQTAPLEAAVTGRDAQLGFAGLLQRHILPETLIAACLGEWRRTAPRDARFEKLQSAAAGEPDPLLAYAAIRRELNTGPKPPL